MSVHVPCWWVFGVLCCLCFSWFFILECCLTSPTWCGKRYFLMVSRVLFLRVFSWEHSVPRFCVYWHLAQAYLLLLLRFTRKLGAVCNHALSAGNVTHHEVLQRVLVLYYDLESFAYPQESYDLWCLRHLSWASSWKPLDAMQIGWRCFLNLRIWPHWWCPANAKRKGMDTPIGCKQWSVALKDANFWMLRT